MDGLQTDDLLNDAVMRLYYLGQTLHTNTSIGLSKKELKGGSFVYVASFTASSGIEGQYSSPLIMGGAVRLSLKFKAATKMPLTLLCLEEFHSELYCNAQRQITCDFLS